MRTLTHITLLALIAGLAVIGCDNAFEPFTGGDDSFSSVSGIEQIDQLPVVQKPAPSNLVSFDFGDDNYQLWPYTGENFSGAPSDPVNLVFVGQADPALIRAALLGLDGDRSALEMPLAAFSDTWNDAIGGIQVAYAEPNGWQGSVYQLECGDHNTIRFHLRLFKHGDWTVGSCHFEFLIPGTTDHQVLNWELAEMIVVADLMRSGLLDETVPVYSTGAINAAPFRTIPTVIYKELPPELQALTGGPIGEPTEDVPIMTDGQATIVNLAGTVAPQPGTWVQDFVIEFGQTIPKPFCASGPADYLNVQGPVHLKQTVRLLPNGIYSVSFRARGELYATPINGLTGEVGETMTAFVRERHAVLDNGNYNSAWSALNQMLGEDDNPDGGTLMIMLRAGSRGEQGYFASVRCGSEVQAVEIMDDEVNSDVIRASWTHSEQ
jgi:hypothetical protein